MFTSKMIVVASLLLFAMGAKDSEKSHYVLLPETEAHVVSQQGSRRVPKRIDGAWTPTQAVVEDLDGHLPLISTLRTKGWLARIPVTDPGSYYRQYVGIIISGHKFVYVNAMCKEPKFDWRRHFFYLDDGATCYWGALYDPKAKQFSDLEFNSVA